MELCKPTQTPPSSSDCVNTLHISSTNTVGEVIEALLKKFLVTESPTKFALYKRCHREDQGTLPHLKVKVVCLLCVCPLIGRTSDAVSKPRDRLWKPHYVMEDLFGYWLFVFLSQRAVEGL